MDTAEQHGKLLPSAVHSRNEMMKDAPAAKKYLARQKAEDLASMLFGDDA